MQPRGSQSLSGSGGHKDTVWGQRPGYSREHVRPSWRLHFRRSTVSRISHSNTRRPRPCNQWVKPKVVSGTILISSTRKDRIPGVVGHADRGAEASLAKKFSAGDAVARAFTWTPSLGQCGRDAQICNFLYSAHRAHYGRLRNGGWGARDRRRPRPGVWACRRQGDCVDDGGSFVGFKALATPRRSAGVRREAPAARRRLTP